MSAFAAAILGGFASLAGGPARGASSAQSGWSTATALGSCVAAVGPRVAFPSESPSLATGRGAIVWVEDPVCRRGSTSTARVPFVLSIAALGTADRALSTRSRPLRGGQPGQLAAIGASRGRVAVAASLGATGASSLVALLQGRATGSLEPGPPLSGIGGPFSLAHAYLGDAAVATVEPGVAIEVRVERYFRSAFERQLRIPIAAGRVSALTATLDYRSDVLVAWQQNGTIYAHMLRASGRGEPTQRVGASAPDPQLQALVSDNDHGMIAWSSGGPPTPTARTSVRIAFSDAGVRFTGSRLVAAFEDRRGVGRSPGSLELVRLSSENVMLAWTAAEHGSYVVRALPAVFAGTRPGARLSDPSRQSVLAALAPGAAGEAVALWRSAPSPGGALEPSRSELWATRTFIESHGRVGQRAPEMVAAAGANASPSVAVDPASDHAVAAWLHMGARPRVEYAIGPGATGYRPPSPGALTPPRGGTSAGEIAIAAAGAGALAALLTALAVRRRAGARRDGDAGIGRRRRRSPRARR